MESVALEALHAAAAAIRKIEGITEATADNDNDSGEVLFTTSTGREYQLRLVLSFAPPPQHAFSAGLLAQPPRCTICGELKGHANHN